MAQSPLTDRLHLRSSLEQLIAATSKNGFRLATAASRVFRPTARAAQVRLANHAPSGLFDRSLTGVARASLERTRELLAGERSAPYAHDPMQASQVEATLDRLEAEWESARLLTLKAAWMADNRIPNSKEASMATAKAGRVASKATLKCPAPLALPQARRPPAKKPPPD